MNMGQAVANERSTDNSTILCADLRVSALIPQLRYFETARNVLFNGEMEPTFLELDVRAKQILGHHRCFCQLAQMVDDTLALCNQVEVLGESFCIKTHRMVFARDRFVFQAPAPDHLLPCLYAHLHHWDKHIAIEELLYLSLPHHKPLA